MNYKYHHPFWDKEATARNRYEEIHVLFQKLAAVKHGHEQMPTEMGERRKIYAFAKDVKAYWKNLFKVETFTELEDSDLADITRNVRNRIEFLKNNKHEIGQQPFESGDMAGV